MSALRQKRTFAPSEQQSVGSHENEVAAQGKYRTVTGSGQARSVFSICKLYEMKDGAGRPFHFRMAIIPIARDMPFRFVAERERYQFLTAS